MEWFRLYNEFATDPKLLSFSKSDRYDVVCLLCLASSSQERGTILLEDEDVAGYIGVPLEAFELFTARLIKKSILERTSEGWLRFIHWDVRQPVSDSAAARMKRYRERHKPNAETNSSVECSTPLRNGDVTVTDRTEQNRTEKNREEKSPARGLCSAALVFKTNYPQTSNPTDDDTLNRVWARYVQPEGLAGEVRIKRELAGWIDSGKWDDPHFVPSMETFISKPKYRTPPPPRKDGQGWDGSTPLEIDPEVKRLMERAERR